MNTSESFLDGILQGLEGISLFLIFLLLSAGFYSVLTNVFSKGIKQSIKVAVIGQPRAGKTTLITVAFDRIMSGNLARHIRVNGVKTVERITNYLSIIRGGGQLNSTEDKDVFAYRYTVTLRRLLFKFQYDVEVADFPGEYTEVLSEDQVSKEVFSSSLVGKEFFSWVLNADRYIFVIDLSETIKSLTEKSHGEPYSYSTIDRDYIERMEALIKNAVLTLKQELLDADVYDRRVLLVFSKADCLAALSSNYHGPQDPILENIGVEQIRLNAKNLQADLIQNEREIIGEFHEIISFLDANFKKVSLVFHSSYLARENYHTETDKIVSFMSP